MNCTSADAASTAGLRHACWQPEPTMRGTFSIVTTCASTLFFTVWTALHKDIPLERQTRWKALRSRFGWMLIGLLAPEYLLVVAALQLLAARQILARAVEYGLASSDPGFVERQWTRLKRLFHRVSRRSADPEIGRASNRNNEKLQRWTLAHGFYVAMGGLAFDVPRDSQDNGGAETEPDTRDRNPLVDAYEEIHGRKSIRYDGFMYLLQNAELRQLIPVITTEDLDAQGKIDAIAKAFAFGQLLWFLANCLSRVAQKLPLSLLESTTIAHATLSAVTYLVWWHKPLNVARPVLITGDTDEERLAIKRVSVLLSMYSKRYAFLCGGLLHSAYKPESSCMRDYKPNLTACRESIDDKWRMLVFGTHRLPWYKPHPGADSLHIHKARWALARAAGERYGQPCESPSDKQFLSPQSTLSSPFWTLNPYKVGPLWLCLPGVYGGLHLAARNAQFPTPGEQSAWLIAGIGLCLPLFDFPYFVLSAILPSQAGKDLRNYLVKVSIVWLPLNPIASAFLLFESIRQLFYLPQAAFEVASWSAYFPHVS